MLQTVGHVDIIPHFVVETYFCYRNTFYRTFKQQNYFWKHVRPFVLFFWHLQRTILHCKRQENVVSGTWALGQKVQRRPEHHHRCFPVNFTDFKILSEHIFYRTPQGGYSLKVTILKASEIQRNMSQNLRTYKRQQFSYSFLKIDAFNLSGYNPKREFVEGCICSKVKHYYMKFCTGVSWSHRCHRQK